MQPQSPGRVEARIDAERGPSSEEHEQHTQWRLETQQSTCVVFRSVKTAERSGFRDSSDSLIAPVASRHDLSSRYRALPLRARACKPLWAPSTMVRRTRCKEHAACFRTVPDNGSPPAVAFLDVPRDMATRFPELSQHALRRLAQSSRAYYTRQHHYILSR